MDTHSRTTNMIWPATKLNSNTLLPRQEEFSRQIRFTALAKAPTPKSFLFISSNYFYFSLHPPFLISKTSKETYPLPIYRSHQMDSFDINARHPWRKVPEVWQAFWDSILYLIHRVFKLDYKHV